jgi:hypothetical protein
MPIDRDPLREWHRLFGLLLTDFFTGTPFEVEIERDLSQQQQFLDVVIIRRRPGRVDIRLPDGMEGLAAHNLITFKSHHESLDSWAMKELVGHYVAYRKLVSASPSDLLPEEQFRLFAVSARYPQNLAGQVPWREVQDGVYHCQWGTDTVQVIVAGQLPREEQNAPLHLFSASPELLGFGQSTYKQHSEVTSRVLGQLFEKFQAEGFAMAFTMADFERQYILDHFPRLTAKEKQQVLEKLSPEDRLAGMSAEEIRQYLEKLTAGKRGTRKPRGKR